MLPTQLHDVGLDAEQQLQRCHRLVTTTLGDEFADANTRDVHELAGETIERTRDSEQGLVGMSPLRPLELARHRGLDALTQRDDRRVREPARLDPPEPVDGRVDDAACATDRLAVRRRRMYCDVPEIDDAHAGEFPNVRPDIMGEGEVDDRQRAHAVQHYLLEPFTVDDRMRRATARHDEICSGQRLVERRLSDDRSFVRLREACGTTAERVEQQFSCSSRAQRGVGDACERTGADQAHGPAGDRPMVTLDEVECHRDDRPSGGSESGRGGDLARHATRRREQAIERRGHGAFPSRFGDGSPHLTGDLDLSDDHRLETGRDREEMPSDVVADATAEARGRIGLHTHRGAEEFACSRDSTLRVLCVEIELDPVARREQHGAVSDVLRQEFAREIERASAGLLELRESDVEVADASEGECHEWSVGARRKPSSPFAAHRDAAAPERALTGHGYPPSMALPDSHPLTRGLTTQAPLLRAYRGERPSQLPVWFMRQAGRSLPEYRALREGTGMLESCLTPELAAEITLQPVRRHGVDAAIFFSDIVVPLKVAGVDVDIAQGIGPVMGRPVRTRSDVLALPELEPADLRPIREAVERCVDELGATPLIGFAGAPFTIASYLIEGRPSRDHLRTRALLHADPETWHALLAWVARTTVTFLRAQVEAGASALQLFDSWAGTLSPPDYRIGAAPHSRAVLEAVADLGVPRVHFGTRTSELLVDLRECGADVVGVDDRTPLAVAIERLGTDIPVQGNIDPALLTAPWPVLERHVLDVIDAGRAARSHIVNLGHGVPPDTDPDVLTRTVELVHSQAG